jgi:pimeloyl-ACP methyl ester carboxylesterase
MAEQAINGIRLYYDERGEGAPIVCIHGAGGTALAWADAVDKLARVGRVIAYDRRGCARSDASRSKRSRKHFRTPAPRSSAAGISSTRRPPR